jgi:acyl-CoA synthetase (AMP-forming)/AMP-acid ligase II
MNAFGLFENSLQQCLLKTALVSEVGAKRRQLSFSELDRQVDNVARQLTDNGLCPGDRVLLAVPVSIETYVVMLAVMKAGMVTMFIDPAHSAARVAGILKAWPPAAIVATKAILLLRFLMPELRHIPKRFVVDARSAGAARLSFTDVYIECLTTTQRSSADSALLTFTSGSTGEPKPVLRTHGFLAQQLKILDQIAEVRKDDIDFVAMPMFVLFNLAKAISSVIPATDMKRPGRADPRELYEQMVRERVSRTVASPALLERLANHCLAKNLHLPDLRCVSTGGGPVSPLLARKLKRIAPNAAVKMVYGSTEAEPIACLDDCDVSVNDRNQTQRGDGLLVGRPVPGCSVRIICSCPDIPVEPCSEETFESLSVPTGKIGEIAVSGTHVLEGYADSTQNRATKIEVDGTIWHRTGDAGYFDATGRLWLVGRCSAAIKDIRGSVYPFQVEYAVNAVKGIRRAALVGYDKQRVLVLETSDHEFRSDCAAAARCVAEHHIDRIITVGRIPMDKRHDAKVDYPALTRLLDGRFSRARFVLVEAVSSAYRTIRQALRHLSQLTLRGFLRICARQ